MIRLVRLRLTGPDRRYEVALADKDAQLAVIAGQIHTGKTTVLEFIDYCLGDDEHPTHPEVARAVRSAALELDVDGARHTIERPAFSEQATAWLRPGGLDDGDLASARRLSLDPSDEDSLSAWLLRQAGLDGIRLQVSRTNPQSSTHVLSFRDLMWLCYLPNQRLDNQQLLHEGNDFKRYKLEQVIELMFDVHDSTLADLLERLKSLREALREQTREIDALAIFLQENEVGEAAAIEEESAAIRAARGEVEDALSGLDSRMAASTQYAADLRAHYARARADHSAGRARVADREALLARLLPLRGQYAEDERKLAFVGESRRLFDPLHVKTCPACLTALPEPPDVVQGACTLCGQAPLPAQEELLDVDRERRALRERIRHLDRYVEEVEHQSARARAELNQLQEAEAQLAAELDTRTAKDLAPFVAEREGLLARRGTLRARAEELGRQARWHEGLVRRRAERDKLEDRIRETKDQIKALRADRPDRDAVLARLSTRFASLLRGWGFPKIDDPVAPYVDERFVPHVRGRPYREIGSSGALTLIAVAWQLTIFEEGVERGSHPGFLMVDSPQKNLSPGRTGSAVDEYADPRIVERMWAHIAAWTRQQPSSQLIAVDNTPPAQVAPYVVVEYTRDPTRPPYGLIDDAVS